MVIEGRGNLLDMQPAEKLSVGLAKVELTVLRQVFARRVLGWQNPGLGSTTIRVCPAPIAIR